MPAFPPLKEEQGKERADLNDILADYRTRVDPCQRKLETLFQMRMDGDISLEEYLERKDNFSGEKNKSEEILSDTALRAETWVTRAETLLSFAETARKPLRRAIWPLSGKSSRPLAPN